jgi:hypothetical protein
MKKKLDRIFSKFIKLRDCGEFYFKCISCGKTKHKDQFNAGHYWSRVYMSTRYDEKNVNGQCIYCNFHLKGHIAGYTQGLIKKYGSNVLNELEIKKNNMSKMGEFEYKILIEEYKQKIKQYEKRY